MRSSGKRDDAAGGPPTAGARGADALRTLREERERLRRAHPDGMSGLTLVRALSAAMDAAVTALWDEAAAGRSGVALVALGGYGRGELSPHSDVDLMVLHAGRRGAEDLGRSIFYALWDAGFKVGHALRSPKDSLRLARVNFEAETSFLEARLLAGDRRLFEEFVAATLRQTRKRASLFLGDVRGAMAARHAKEGHASYMLEPNLKEGAGGLRDLHALGWLARVFDAELLDERDRAELRNAAELLHRTRNHLHYVADRAADVLLIQLQEATALVLGYRDGRADGWSAWDAFMRDLYTATRTVEHVVGQVMGELGRPAAGRGRSRDLGDGVVLEEGRVGLAPGASVGERPELPAALYAAAAREGLPVGVEAQRALRDELERAPALPWTDAVRRAFFALLGAGSPEALEALDHLGAMTRYVPEWEAVRCRPQHNVYHRFTVDVHAFQTAARLARLDGEEAEPLAAQVARDVRDRDALLLAGLLHDLGKGYPGDHSAVGEDLARRIGARMGLHATQVEAVAWLVRHHLLLVDTATRRDTGDENLVVETAAQVGDPERLRMLYALSVADGLATGPTAWTPWKSALVGELFTKMLHVLERGDLTSRDATELWRLRTAELRTALERHPAAAVEAHLAGMPRAYFLAFSTSDLIRHFALMADPIPAGDVRTHVAPTGERGVTELVLVAPDRPGLFSKASGALALGGINIISAQIFTRADGAALEVFRVTGAFEAEIDRGRWDRVGGDLRAALGGRLALDARLTEKRSAYGARPARGKREAPRVIVDNAASDFATVVEVHAPDRIGLLYAVTSALAELELDIHLAKIATYGEDVVDAFYVRDLEGQKVTDPPRIDAVERRLLGALDEI